MSGNYMQLPPIRSLKDFVLSEARFSAPDYQDNEKWSNRVASNLLYYQTNYFAIASVIFLIAMFFKPLETSIGGILVIGMLFVLIYVSQNKRDFQLMMKKYPAFILIGVVAVATLIMYTFGSVLVFVFIMALTMLIILLHASFRMRNFKNKLQRKTEEAGLKKSPMGAVLFY